MNELALSFYCAAGLAEATALILVLRTLPSRLTALRAPMPPEPEMPLSYNESLTVIEQILAARDPAVSEAMLRRGLNELIAALKAETYVRATGYTRLAVLTDAPAHRRDLLLATLLLAVGVLLGVGGNIAGTVG
jgi:hypothetical protein